MMKKIWITIVFICALAVNIYFGFQKSGFHEDEYYTYYSTNRSLGLYQSDREWQDGRTILDEFTVKKGEGFNYGLVRLVQSWDVHPPMYYFIFHTICSLFAGIFTKWTGIITNLIAFAISYFALYAILERLRSPLYAELLTLLFWGLNPQTVSCNMLIRMYAWLTAAIFLCAYFHIRFIQDYSRKKSFNIKELLLRYLLPIAIVSYCGFLIQYFYIFFFVPLGFALSVWLFFIRKDYRTTFAYIISCVIGLGLAVLSYPASLSHIFGGYRGADAAEGLLGLSGTGLRLSFFVGLLNDFVFAGGLILIIAVLLIGIIRRLAGNKKRKQPKIENAILTIGVAAYFVLTAKAALLVGAASNRYEMPIYGLAILLIIADAFYVTEESYKGSKFKDNSGGSRLGKNTNNTAFKYLIITIFMALLLKGLVFDNSVLFLYKEDTAKIAYAAENRDEVAIVMFNPATPQNVWRLTDELLEYPRVYYMDEENLAPVTDSAITNADKIILYAADDDLQEAAFENLIECSSVETLTLVSTEDMWATYECN